MELSTIMPTAMASEHSVTRLSVMWRKFMTANVSRMHSGIEMPMTMVLRTLRRKMNTTSTARTAPMMAERPTELKDALMKSAAS